MKKILDPVTGLRFPDPREEAKARAEEFRRLSTDQRLAAMRDVLELGTMFLNRSTERQKVDEIFLRREAEWQRIQKEIFAHGA